MLLIIVACLFFKRKRETFEQNVPYKQFYEMITYNMKHKMDDPEPQYEYIKPKIFVEPLIYPIPQDIKVFYYNGKPVTIEIDVGRFTNHTRNYYDTEGNLMKMKHNNYDNTKKGSKTILDDIKKHDKLGELIKITDKLAKGVSLNLFRVDIYYVGGEFYGGEITLTAGAGKGQN